MSKYYLSKIILLILDDLKFLIKLILTKNFIDKILYFIHGGVGYYGNLKSDLESLEKVLILRDYFIPPKKKQKIIKKKNKKIGFLVNFSSRSLFNLDHFKSIPNNFEVFIFEFNNSVNGYNQSLKLFKKFKNKKIKVSILKLHNSWSYDFDKQSKIAEVINSFSLDYLIFDTGVFHLHLLNELITPKIISYNKTSLIVPSSKIDIQSFCQPCFPYKVKKNKIYNFKNKNNLNIKVDDSFIIYQSRNIKFKLNNKRKYILWYGNFKKFYDPKFLNLIEKILIKYPSLELHAFGRNDDYKKQSKVYFKKKKTLNIHFHEIFDWNVKNQYFENFLKVLKQTKIMINSFRMSGARYAIESYQFGIPIINFNLDDKAWLKNPDNLYYKVPKILIDENTVNNENDYLKLIDKILNDRNFEKKLISLQKKKFNHLTSKKFFWKKINQLIEKADT